MTPTRFILFNWNAEHEKRLPFFTADDKGTTFPKTATRRIFQPAEIKVCANIYVQVGRGDTRNIYQTKLSTKKAPCVLIH